MANLHHTVLINELFHEDVSHSSRLLVVFIAILSNSFGIILEGSASVHVRKEQSGLPHQDATPVPRLHKDRNLIIGPEIGLLTAGNSFGEMIVTSNDHHGYNTTLVAEETTCVLFIDKELYSRSFAAHQLEWQRKVDFVNLSPLFKKMTPAIKKLLIDNLKPREIQFGNRFVRQGDACNSLFFISRGWAKVIADIPLSRIQFEEMKMKATKTPNLSGRRSSFSGRERQTGRLLDLSRPLSVIERRRYRQKYGYDAIEALFRHREFQITTAGPNDVIGDIELTLNLPTYCASVECLENLQVYELNHNNFHHIIAHRSPKTYNHIKKGVLSKLCFRSQRAAAIPLYSFLYECAQPFSKDWKSHRPELTTCKKKVVEIRKKSEVGKDLGQAEPVAESPTGEKNEYQLRASR